MSTTAIVARNLKRIRLVAKYAAKRKELKEAGDYFGLQKLPRNSSPNRVQSRCFVTGKSRGVYKTFGLCRNQFRQMALDGKIPGITKASW
jgi:small subunit ribosomal protein S14